jgi:hypothetical protein
VYYEGFWSFELETSQVLTLAPRSVNLRLTKTVDPQRRKVVRKTKFGFC